MIQISPSTPGLYLANTIWLPSGFHSGPASLYASSYVSRVTPDPSLFITYTSMLPLPARLL